MATDMAMVTDTAMVNEQILITGGAGFIGSNLVDYFLKQGARVSVLDNFSTGYRKNIEAHLSNPRFTLFEGDIRNMDDCRVAMKQTTFVLHHAAVSSLTESFLNPSLITEINVSGFLNILIAAKEEKVKRVIYASSASVYGNLSLLPKKEQDVGNPVTPYAVSKLTNELYADVYSKNYGVVCVGLRYFNVYGRRQDFNSIYSTVIPVFMKELVNHQSPIINGSGNHSRDFVHIDDVVTMNELAMTTGRQGSIDTVYNVATGERTTLNELFFQLKKKLGEVDPQIKRIKASHGPIREGDVLHSVANIRKAMTLLGFRPAFTLNEGLTEMVNWYWTNRKEIDE